MPRTRSAKGKKLEALSQDDFDNAVKQNRNAARDFIDNEKAPDQQTFWDYYNGQSVLPTSPNRSRFVVTEVQDAVEAMVPSLLRIFLTAPTPAEFIPAGPNDYELSRQQTDAANHVFFNDNRGNEILEDAFRDGLVADYAAVKSFWDESIEIEEIEYTDLSLEVLAGLEADPEVEIVKAQGTSENGADVTVRHTKTTGKICVEGIPTEEFIINKRATCVDDAIIVGMDGLRRAYELVNAGLATWQEIEDHGSGSSMGDTNTNMVRSARAAYATDADNIDGSDQNEVGDDSQRLIRFSEIYCRIDKDGDGVPELWRVLMIADTVIEAKIWDKSRIQLVSPFRRAHTAIGYGVARISRPYQDVSTAVARNMLDSLYSAVNPQHIAVANQINLNDLLKNEFNGIIRARQPGMLESYSTPFVGGEGLSVMEWLEGRKEMAIGVTKASLGLDPDQLQSSTESAVMMAHSASNLKVETIARTFAEGLMAPVFTDIAELLAEHQKDEMYIRARGNFVPIDPASWHTTLDIEPVVGLGRGQMSERTALMEATISKQEELIATQGPTNPLTNIVKYSTALNDMLDMHGVKERARYFNTPEQAGQIAQQMAQAAAQRPPEPDSDQAKIAIEQAKAQAETARKDATAQADIARENWKAEQEMRIKFMEFGAEAELERLKVEETNGQGPGVGNIPTQ